MSCPPSLFPWLFVLTRLRPVKLEHCAKCYNKSNNRRVRQAIRMSQAGQGDFNKSEMMLDDSVNRKYIGRSLCRHEGRFAVVTKRGAGCDGRLRRQAGSSCRRKRGGVRRSRVVLAPRPWRLFPPACAGGTTVTSNAAHRGEHEVSRKAIARGRP